MNEAEKAIFGVSERRLTRDLQPIQNVLSDYTIASTSSPGGVRILSVCRAVFSTWTGCSAACNPRIS